MKTIVLPYPLLQAVVDDANFSETYRNALVNCDVSEDTACIAARQLISCFLQIAEKFNVPLEPMMVDSSEAYGIEPSEVAHRNFIDETGVQHGDIYIHHASKKPYVIQGLIKVRTDDSIGWLDNVHYRSLNDNNDHFAQPFELFQNRFYMSKFTKNLYHLVEKYGSEILRISNVVDSEEIYNSFNQILEGVFKVLDQSGTGDFNTWKNHPKQDPSLLRNLISLIVANPQHDEEYTKRFVIDYIMVSAFSFLGLKHE